MHLPTTRQEEFPGLPGKIKQTGYNSFIISGPGLSLNTTINSGYPFSMISSQITAKSPLNDQQTKQQPSKDYRFIRALRPFSLFIALATTGIVFARLQHQQDFSEFLAVLVVIGAVLAQAAVNLMNDWSERHLVDSASSDYLSIRKNFQFACAGFTLAALIGLIITVHRGWPIVGLAIVGFVTCLSYTLEPINLKRRGLGLVAVFLVMGPILMLASGFAMSGHWHIEILLDSLIFSPLISLVLLANELRDYERDRLSPDNTLTVRIGFTWSSRLFLLLIATTVMAYGTAVAGGLIARSWVLLVPLCIAMWLTRVFLLTRPNELHRLPPLTGRLVLATALAHAFAVMKI